MITYGTFKSIAEMSKEVYPFLPIKHLISHKFDALEKISKLRVPKLIVHSEYDEIVPFKHAEELYLNAMGPKECLWINGNHNEAIYTNEQEFIDTVNLFLRKHGV